MRNFFINLFRRKKRPEPVITNDDTKVILGEYCLVLKGESLLSSKRRRMVVWMAENWLRENQIDVGEFKAKVCRQK